MSEQSYEDAFREWLEKHSGDDYIGKEKKEQFRNNWMDSQQQKQNQTRLNSLFSDEPQNTYGLSGSTNEVSGRLEGLERAKMLTGQNSAQIGKDYQEAYGNIKKRSTLTDTGSEMIRASKAGAVADARNQLQSAGVKGGAAVKAVSEVERQKAYDVNNQLADNQRKAEMDYMNAVKSNANFTTSSEMNYGALAAGEDYKAPQAQSNGFGTVICTELYEQGFFSDKVYQADVTYGSNMKIIHPDIYWGYRFLADPIVRKMKVSKRFTKLVAFFAVPWARNMAGDKNFLGATVAFIGEPLCLIVGKIIGGKYAHSKA